MNTTSEELRIIAKDGQRLTALDRDAIAAAADELDDLHRQLVATQRALMEVQSERNAKAERLTELARPHGSIALGFRMLPMTVPNWNYPR